MSITQRNAEKKNTHTHTHRVGQIEIESKKKKERGAKKNSTQMFIKCSAVIKTPKGRGKGFGSG